MKVTIAFASGGGATADVQSSSVDRGPVAADLHLGCVRVRGPLRQQIGQIEDAEERGKSFLEDLRRVELVGERFRDVAAPWPTRRVRLVMAKFGVANPPACWAEDSTLKSRTRQRAGGVLLDDLGEEPGLVRGVAKSTCEIGRGEPDRRRRGAAADLLDCGNADVALKSRGLKKLSRVASSFSKLSDKVTKRVLSLSAAAKVTFCPGIAAARRSRLLTALKSACTAARLASLFGTKINAFAKSTGCPETSSPMP